MNTAKTGDIMFDLSVKFMGKPLSKALGYATTFGINVTCSLVKPRGATE